MIIVIDRKKSVTYHFTRRNDLTINTQVLLKCILTWRKSNNIVTMTSGIVRINSPIMTFHNNQRHVHHTTSKNSSINVFVILFVCSIIQKIIIIQLLLQPIIWQYLQVYTLPYIGWINASSIFKYQERDNIVLQTWQLRGILLIVTAW